MQRKSNRTITKILYALVMLAVAAIPVFGHGGFDHVMGTVVTVSGDVLTVKTAKGNVDLTLEAKTEFSKNSQKAQRSDLLPGTRVVVDVVEGSKTKAVHSVKIGVADAEKEGTHHDHK